MSHDQRFKGFIQRFLPQVVRLFLPKQAARLDFQTLNFLDKELIINLPHQELRITDVVTEVNTLEGESETIIVHIEVEARAKKPLPRRMADYYALLRILRDKRVLPIAMVLVPGRGGIRWKKYSEKLFDEELLRFRYVEISLRGMASDEYLAKNDPVAAALAAVMKMDQEHSAETKLTIMQQIDASDLSMADKLFLMAFVNAYLPKDKVFSEKEWVMKQLTVIEETSIDKALREGREEGEQKGKQEGKHEGKHEALLTWLTLKFGELPAEIVARVKSVQDDEILRILTQQVFYATVLEDVKLPPLLTKEKR